MVIQLVVSLYEALRKILERKSLQQNFQNNESSYQDVKLNAIMIVHFQQYKVKPKLV